ncbi:MAG: exodeoxyribonuclease VII large subunit [Ignavibacteriae bacterium]|nr:exodeoxyribonuclease VII large subunit [Ignavibacteriota bacterium]
MPEKIQSVSELTKKIQFVLEGSFDTVTVQGEISNYKHHSSGHRYFSLKDENSQIACTMWKTRPVRFQMSDGMKVVITGKISVYPPQGKYQIDVISVTPLGQGDLYLAFEALKKKLDEQGYFTSERKRAIPALPMKIGVSTSPTGAAFHDIFSTIERRFPLAEIYFRPTLVQGDGSAEDIVKAIYELNTYSLDVIIIGRGGGSIEDLWSYNTEIVADAIYNSSIPIISAVGHEVDFTIADFVSDIRAATPTAAAELVTPVTIDYLFNFTGDALNSLVSLTTDKIQDYMDIIDDMSGPSMSRRIIEKIKTNGQLIDDYETRNSQNIKRTLSFLSQRLSLLEGHCKSLNPVAPFNKGFALLESEGKIISKDDSLGNYIYIDIIRQNERANVTINKVIPKNN